MAKTQSQIQAEKKKLVEDFASTQKSLDEIHERQMEDLPEDYEEKLKSAVDAANESFEKYQAAEKDQGENAGDKLSEERKQEYLTGKAAMCYNNYYNHTPCNPCNKNLPALAHREEERNVKFERSKRICIRGRLQSILQTGNRLRPIHHMEGRNRRSFQRL